MSPPRSAALLAGAALVSFACASAVQPLDTTSELGRVDPESIDVEAAASLAADAAREFDRRPDADAVHRAEDLWIRSAIADPYSALAIIGAVQAQTWLGENLDDEQARKDKATEAVQTAQWCRTREPTNPDCHYWLAIAVGVQANQRLATASDGLRVMERELRAAIAGNEDLDYAGPRRVLSQMLVRAPGWPTGPGDDEEGLEHARRAVELHPEFPPNLLALAEAYAALDDVPASRATYQRAIDLAGEWQQRGHPDADAWIKAGRGLSGRD
ncbi:MAG TPA: hypothetical protein QGG47_02200 [Acidobacteriota bacterium]|nr:hypothetical protein [Acidobacteriota bacterium]